MNSTSRLKPVDRPELVVALAGAIGTNLDLTIEAVQGALKSFDYRCVPVRLTERMESIEVGVDIDNSEYFKRSNSLIDYGNAIRRTTNTQEMMAVIGIQAIRAERNLIREELGIPNEDTRPPEGVAYIVRQLKRSEEADLLRRVYGRQFILISVHSSADERFAYLKSKAIQFGVHSYNDDELKDNIGALIKRDEDEADNPYGQRIRETFPKADLFTRVDDELHVRRFFRAFFGNNSTSPNTEEYGMYLAKAAALRSLDLSRQVGAAIVSEDGEVISLGCNEVPKGLGGSYWDGDPSDSRDYKLGYDPNEREKRGVLADLVERLKNNEILSDERFGSKTLDEIISDFLNSPTKDGIKHSRLMDLIEFGRVVHAEMHALSEAARFGRKVGGATMYCTTFPCHICAKHIVASGIKKVFYIEPYAKSYAHALHFDSISLNGEAQKVSFSPFIGISPARYRDLFEAGRRKSPNGNFLEWKTERPLPRLDVYFQTHQFNEDAVLGSLYESTRDDVTVEKPPD